MRNQERQSLYGEVTHRIIAELEEGRLPWVQPWDAARCPCTMPHNGVSGRSYSGINVLILWAAVIGGGYSSQRWLTYRQAEAAGGQPTVRHSDYIGAWLAVLRADEKAIFRAASAASKAADFLLSHGEDR